MNYKKTLKLLLLSHGIFVLILFLVGAFLSFFLPLIFWKYSIGLLLGGLGGCLLIISMSYSIGKAIDKDAESAQKYMLKHFLFRTLLMMGLLLIGIFFDINSLLGIAVGLLCVKLGGYFEPYIERKFFNKINKERRK